MSHKRNADASKTPKDEQRTPPELFRKLDERFHFDLDAACTPKNCLSRNRYGFTNTPGEDALERPWHNRFTMDNGEYASIFYCNPPYSNGMIEKFLLQGYQASLLGDVAVFLITSDVSPGYYDICALAAEWIAIKGRVEFNHEDGTPIKGSAMFGSNVIVFDQKQKVRQGGQTIVTRMEWK